MRVACDRCGCMLGHYTNGVIESRFRTRNRSDVVFVGIPQQIQCPNCGSVWTPPGSAGGTATASAA